MLKLNKTITPHFGRKILFEGADLKEAASAMILIHGRGASAESILELTKVFNFENISFIAPQADNFTWYPNRFIEERYVNEPGVSSGLKLIDNIVNELKNIGINRENIYLLGFSQGACLILDYIARFPQKLGAVFAFSGGLIGKEIIFDDYAGDLQNTSVFLGCSDVDFHIPIKKVNESAVVFENLNANVTKRIYKNIGHTIIEDEIEFVNTILTKNLVPKGV